MFFPLFLLFLFLFSYSYNSKIYLLFELFVWFSFKYSKKRTNFCQTVVRNFNLYLCFTRRILLLVLDLKLQLKSVSDRLDDNKKYDFNFFIIYFKQLFE